MKKKRYVLFSFIYLFLLTFSPWSFAEEKKKYPPYPDVWGYEFPWPGKQNRYSSINVIKMENGDYMITYVKGWDEKINKYAGVLFFSRGKRDFTKADYNELWSKNKEIDKNQIVLSDETKIEPYSDYACGRCCPLFHFYIVKRDKNGQIVKKMNLVYLLENPFKIPINMYCEYNEGPSGLRRNYVLTKVVNINPKFVPLEDNTFLVVDVDGNTITRFDNNLNTKSDLLNKKIYAIDRIVVDDLRDKLKMSNRYNDQTLADAIHDYLTTLKKEEKK
jgi:hypothetical protein